MPLPRDELVAKVEQALSEGLDVQPELNIHELAEFVVDHVRQQPAPVLDRQQVIAQRLKEI